MKKVISFVVIIVLLVLAGVFLLINYNEKECSELSSKNFVINYFDENNLIKSQSVCISCIPESYDELFIPIKEGKSFEGWYYDKELTDKVDAHNTYEIYPVELYKGNCIVAYKDVDLYAKFN